MIQQRLSRTLQTLARQQRQCFKVQRSPISSSPFPSRSFAPPASQRIVQRRCYSQEAAEAKKEESAANAASEEQKPAQEEQKSDTAQKELEAKQKEVIDLNDRLRRSVADYRNLQEQTKREVQSSKEFALQRFSKDLLDSVDNLDRALSIVPADKLTEANKDLVDLHNGLKMTETILMQTLKKHGLERFDPSVEGDKFDPNRHEAVFQAPQPNASDGSVFYTQQKGFTLNGRVLRAAKVGVAKNS